MQSRKVALFALAAILVFIASAAKAQGYRGTDFWICFPQNAILLEGGHGLEQTLYIASDYRTHGTIEREDDTVQTTFDVEAGAAVSVNIDTTYELTSSSQIERKSLHVTTNHPITLYVVSHRKASTDSYAAIPTPLLGTEYEIAGYTTLNVNGIHTLATQAQIVATEENTIVTARLTGSTKDGRPAGRSISMPMNRGDVFQLQGGGTVADLTGTIVTSTKPIAFVTGHRCAQVPAGVQFCDMLMEMEPPMEDWGKDFISTKFEGKTNYGLRILAREDSTEIQVDGKKVAVLNKSGFCEIDTLQHDAFLRTSKPTLVAQYSTSAEADTEKIGDPFMLLLVPNDRFVTEASTSSIGTAGWMNYANIVVPDSAMEFVRIDGQYVKTGNARKIGKFAVLPREMTAGSHTITCPIPIAVYSYGFGYLDVNYDSYGHTCGMRLDEFKKAK